MIGLKRLFKSDIIPAMPNQKEQISGKKDKLPYDALRSNEYELAIQFLNAATKIACGGIEVFSASDANVLFDPSRTRFFPDGIVCDGGEFDSWDYGLFQKGEINRYKSYVTAVVGNNYIRIPFFSDEKREESI